MTHRALLALMLVPPMAFFADLTAYKIQCPDIVEAQETCEIPQSVLEAVQIRSRLFVRNA
jgi:hypothetical protein